LTCPASSLDCEDSCSAAPSTCVAAEPVSSAAFWTPEMLVVTLLGAARGFLDVAGNFLGSTAHY